MVLTALQQDIVHRIAANRSDTSYVAGGIVLNRDWPRRSDDIDIFHDTDEEIGDSANADLATLRTAGFRADVEIEIYGLVEAVVSNDEQATIIQWMSESRTRFFPLVRDAEWGARLHQIDLAINKVIAGASRTKARDFVDLVTISQHMCRLGPLVVAAAGKPPHFSPRRIVDEIRRRGFSVSDDDYHAVKGLPHEWNARTIRQDLADALDLAEAYLLQVPADIIGLLAIDGGGIPVEIHQLKDDRVTLRRATMEPEAMPSFPDSLNNWGTPGDRRG